MAYLHRRNVHLPDMQAMEPPEPDNICTCTRCGTVILVGDRTFETNHGDVLCLECFGDKILGWLNACPEALADKIGFEVVRHV